MNFPQQSRSTPRSAEPCVKSFSSSRRSKSYTTSPMNSSAVLHSVPEDSHDTPGVSSSSSSPPRARSSSYNHQLNSLAQGKGKGKAAAIEREPSSPPRAAKPRSEWVVDLIETRDGMTRWATNDRIILVLGYPTPDLLAPLLYNPSFSNTLLLIGSDTTPRSEFLHMSSPSYLLSSERPIYPTVQAFSPNSKKAADQSHPLAALIAHATVLGDAYRSSSKSKSKSRSESFDAASLPSVGSGFGSSSRLSTLFRRESDAALDVINDLNRFEAGDSPKFSRSRLSSFGSIAMKRSDSNNSSTSPSGSPFDVVLHFLPSAAHNPARTLHGLLHQTMMVSTGLMPLLTSRRASSSTVVKGTTFATPSDDITVLHILPPDAPISLGPAVEQFIISLLPAMQTGDRPIWAGVTSTKVWMTPRVCGGTADGEGSNTLDSFNYIGAEIILFNGVRACIPAEAGALPHKLRVYLPSWSDCVSVPGLLADSRASPPLSEVNTPHSSPPITHESHLEPIGQTASVPTSFTSLKRPEQQNIPQESASGQSPHAPLAASNGGAGMPRSASALRNSFSPLDMESEASMPTALGFMAGRAQNQHTEGATSSPALSSPDLSNSASSYDSSAGSMMGGSNISQGMTVAETDKPKVGEKGKKKRLNGLGWLRFKTRN